MIIETALLIIGNKSIANINLLLKSISKKVEKRLYIRLTSSVNIHQVCSLLLREAFCKV